MRQSHCAIRCLCTDARGTGLIPFPYLRSYVCVKFCSLPGHDDDESSSSRSSSTPPLRSPTPRNLTPTSPAPQEPLPSPPANLTIVTGNGADAQGPSKKEFKEAQGDGKKDAKEKPKDKEAQEYKGKKADKESKESKEKVKEKKKHKKEKKEKKEDKGAAEDKNPQPATDDTRDPNAGASAGPQPEDDKDKRTPLQRMRSHRQKGVMPHNPRRYGYGDSRREDEEDDDRKWVRCEICWTWVRAGGLEQHKETSKKCLAYQRGRDPKETKKQCPRCTRWITEDGSGWALYQHYERCHRRFMHEVEQWGPANLKGSKRKSSEPEGRSLSGPVRLAPRGVINVEAESDHDHRRKAKKERKKKKKKSSSSGSSSVTPDARGGPGTGGPRPPPSGGGGTAKLLIAIGEALMLEQMAA